jgi:hypothetical protein
VYAALLDSSGGGGGEYLAFVRLVAAAAIK